MQNVIAIDQSKEVVAQAEFVLGTAQQDLILRVAIVYFDVLLAQFNMELAEAQKAAVSEQLAQAKRNFEVGVATITDTNEAQAKYDQIVAGEITTRNEYDNRMTALRAIIGRFPKELKRIGGELVPKAPEPNALDYWVELALKDNLSVRISQASYDIANLEVDRAKAGHYPTLDLVGSLGAQGSNGTVNTGVSSDSRSAAIGLQFAVPIYAGGGIESRVREAVALKEKDRQDLETSRRIALFNAQTGYSGVNSAVASVKAFEQALISAQTAYASNKLGTGSRRADQPRRAQYATDRVFDPARSRAGLFQLPDQPVAPQVAVGALTESDLEGSIASSRAERLRVFRSCPLITPEDARASLQMLAIARAMAALCASIGRLLARRSDTPEKLSASSLRRRRRVTGSDRGGPTPRRSSARATPTAGPRRPGARRETRAPPGASTRVAKDRSAIRRRRRRARPRC